MRLKIDKISRKEINTTRGLSWKLSIFSGNQWYGAWAADWNAGWREGQTIDVELKTRQFNGKTYTDIKGLTQAGQPSQQMVPDSHVLDEISRNVGQVMIEVLEIKKMMADLTELQGAPLAPTPEANQSGPEEEVPPHTDEDMPF